MMKYCGGIVYPQSTHRWAHILFNTDLCVFSTCTRTHAWRRHDRSFNYSHTHTHTHTLPQPISNPMFFFVALFLTTIFSLCSGEGAVSNSPEEKRVSKCTLMSIIQICVSELQPPMTGWRDLLSRTYKCKWISVPNKILTKNLFFLFSAKAT